LLFIYLAIQLQVWNKTRVNDVISLQLK